MSEPCEAPMNTLEEHRTGILRSLATAIATVVIAIYVTFEAYRRLPNPSPVALLGVAAISAGIALVISWRTSQWVLGSVGAVPDRAPADVDLPSVRDVLATTPGVIDVHDVHVWSLHSGVKAMTARVVILDFEDRDDMLTDLSERATRELGIVHVTIQLEPSSWETHETHV